MKSYPKLQKSAFLVGIIGVAIAMIGFTQGLTNGDSRPLFSWLLGFTVWFSVGLGLLLLVMIFNIFDAGWSVIIRRQLEHALAGFPVVALAFVPLLIIAWFHSEPGIIWKWMDLTAQVPGGHGIVGEDPLYINKAGLLNLPFFTLRAIFYFSFILFLCKKLRYNSFSMDKDSNPKYVFSNRVFSGIGIPLTGLVLTFAAFDFYMSLSYHWFSTMYGVWFFATSMRAALAITVIICVTLATQGHLKGIFQRSHLYYLGCLFLAFTVFWAYISFCQYFLIYNANIPEETFWYKLRELGSDEKVSSWWWISLFCLILGNFIIPFLAMLFYKTKVTTRRMVFMSCWIFTFFIFDIYFNILPGKIEAQNAAGYVIRQFSLTLFDLASILGIGGLCLWAFCRSMPKQEPIPIHDPRIEESLHCHE